MQQFQLDDGQEREDGPLRVDVESRALFDALFRQELVFTCKVCGHVEAQMKPFHAV